MNVTESTHVNRVCSFLLGPLEHEQEVSAEEALKSLASLAEAANKRLMAGWSGGIVVARERTFKQLADRVKRSWLPKGGGA